MTRIGPSDAVVRSAPMGDPFSTRAVARAYDAVADAYSLAFGDELDRLPGDVQVLDAASRAAPPGLALEVGCGPAQCAAWLRSRGVAATGCDLSSSMLASARAAHPGVLLAQADVRALPYRDASCTLVVARYVLQHLPRADLVPVLDELRRVLDVDGCLMLATHLGAGDVRISELLGVGFEPIGATLHGRTELIDALSATGFDVEIVHERGPVDGEGPTQRLSVVARAR
jgi:SAM-dependent methyltransferase